MSLQPISLGLCVEVWGGKWGPRAGGEFTVNNGSLQCQHSTSNIKNQDFCRAEGFLITFHHGDDSQDPDWAGLPGPGQGRGEELLLLLPGQPGPRPDGAHQPERELPRQGPRCSSGSHYKDHRANSTEASPNLLNFVSDRWREYFDHVYLTLVLDEGCALFKSIK